MSRKEVMVIVSEMLIRDAFRSTLGTSRLEVGRCLRG